MKKYYHLLFILFAGFAACTKEDQTLDPKDSNNVIEFYNVVPDVIASPTTSTYPMYIYSFDAIPGQEQDFKVTVNYAGEGTAPEDIAVAIELAPDAIDVYNDDNSEGFIELPTSLYSIDTWNVTIPKGQKQASITFKLKTADFDFAEAYAIPLRIKTVSHGIISGNYGTMLFRVVAKNKWDGIYKMTGTFVDHTLPLATYYGEQEFHLETISATQCDVFNETLGTYGYLWLNNGGATYYGSWALRLTFDPATDKIVSAVNAYGQPSGNGRSAALDPSGLNRYDNATKNIDIKYYLLQPGTTIRSEMNDHWEYEGPR